MEEIARLAPSATVVYVVPNSENATELPLAVLVEKGLIDTLQVPIGRTVSCSGVVQIEATENVMILFCIKVKVSVINSIKEY